MKPYSCLRYEGPFPGAGLPCPTSSGIAMSFRAERSAGPPSCLLAELCHLSKG